MEKEGDESVLDISSGVRPNDSVVSVPIAETEVMETEGYRGVIDLSSGVRPNDGVVGVPVAETDAMETGAYGSEFNPSLRVPVRPGYSGSVADAGVMQMEGYGSQYIPRVRAPVRPGVHVADIGGSGLDLRSAVLPNNNVVGEPAVAMGYGYGYGNSSGFYPRNPNYFRIIPVPGQELSAEDVECVYVRDSHVPTVGVGRIELCISNIEKSKDRLGPINSLKMLALHAMKEYIVSLYHFFVHTPTEKLLPEFKENYVLPICRSLQEHFDMILPSSYATYVFNELLNCITICVFRTLYCFDGKVDWFRMPIGANWWSQRKYLQNFIEYSCRVFGCKIEEEYYRFMGDHENQFSKNRDHFLKEYNAVAMHKGGYFEWGITASNYILNAIVQPSISKLTFKRGICIITETLFCKLQQVKEINLSRDFTGHLPTILLNCVKFYPNLQIFEYSNCTDKIIKDLSTFCTQLIKLNISGSLEVTSKSVPSLLEFQKLEDLDISYSCITLSGIEDLYRGFEQKGSTANKVHRLCMTIFMIPAPPNLRVDCLVNAFPNLRTLQLASTCGSLTPLQDLRNLTDFSLESGNRENFDLIKEYLPCISKQITTLKLGGFINVGLKFIHTHFPHLHHLLLHSSIKREDTVPQFTTVRYLDLGKMTTRMMSYVVTKFPDLDQLKMERYMMTRHTVKLTIDVVKLMEQDIIRQIVMNDHFTIVKDGEHVLVTYENIWQELRSKQLPLREYTDYLHAQMIKLEEVPTDFILHLLW